MCKLRNSKVFVVVTVLACLPLWLPMVATASPDNPKRPVDDSVSFDDLDLFLCPFPIHVDIVGKTKTNISTNGMRGVTVFPGENATIVNLTNGKQVKLNITGSFHDITENGITREYFNGRNLTWDETVGFVLIIGHWYWEYQYQGSYDSPGPLVTHLTNVGGKLFNVCDMVAGTPSDAPPTPTPTAPSSPLPTPTPTAPPPPAP